VNVRRPSLRPNQTIIASGFTVLSEGHLPAITDQRIGGGYVFTNASSAGGVTGAWNRQ
jgi:hypothetical protein